MTHSAPVALLPAAAAAAAAVDSCRILGVACALPACRTPISGRSRPVQGQDAAAHSSCTPRCSILSSDPRMPNNIGIGRCNRRSRSCEEAEKCPWDRHSGRTADTDHCHRRRRSIRRSTTEIQPPIWRWPRPRLNLCRRRRTGFPSSGGAQRRWLKRLVPLRHCHSIRV